MAGSGKTLILLYRLRLLYELYPQKRYLVLTHNKPLIRDLESRFFKLAGKLPENIEWDTFNGWCRNHWPKSPRWINPLSNKERLSLVRESRVQNFQDTSINEGMLSSEIDWYKDRAPMECQEYLSVELRGRGFRLSMAQRERMFEAIRAYQQLLSQKNALDWTDVPQKMWGFLSAGQVFLQPYDVALVDDAQFFAPLGFEILRRQVKPSSGHLFVVRMQPRDFWAGAHPGYHLVSTPVGAASSSGAAIGLPGKFWTLPICFTVCASLGRVRMIS